MYEAYFGLRENPFTLSPDPRYLFLSKQHGEALNHLLYGITEKKGFILITGGIGTGKTTVLRSLLSSMDDSTRSALIFNSFLSDMELLRTISEEFGITFRKGRKTKKHFIDALSRFLLKNFAAGRNAVLLIDEAQNLSASVLEQIRMLSNLETEREKLLQIVLVGQPELKTILESPSLRQLNERITVRYEIAPLSNEQVKSYIKHRLSIAGGTEDCPGFTSGASSVIHGYSQGIPRRINAICDRALLIAYAKNKKGIKGGIVKSAIRDLGAGYEPPSIKRLFTNRRSMFACGIVLGGIIAVIGIAYHEEVTRAISSIKCLFM